MNHSERIRNAADQLLRYGLVCDDRLLDVLDLLADINDDISHLRERALVERSCEKAAFLLKEIAASYSE